MTYYTLAMRNYKSTDSTKRLKIMVSFVATLNKKTRIYFQLAAVLDISTSNNTR